MASPAHRLSESPIDILDETHSGTFRRALSNVLMTELTFETYAQIIDGLPLKDVAWDRNPRACRICLQHPINTHVKLCRAAFDRTVRFLNEFDASSLKFNHETLAAYQAAPKSSRSFNMRLVELTAHALHQIALHLFQKFENHHSPETTTGLDVEAVTLWTRHDDPPELFPPLPPFPTLFTHGAFTAHKYYPNGVADMVGYWAQDRILGGVALFDHSRNWGVDQRDREPNMWYQSARAGLTYRICQLLDEQQEQIVRFLLDERGNSEGVQCPFPILTSTDNRTRMDSSDAVSVYKVYQNPWERPYLGPPTRLQRKGPCIRNRIDYPELPNPADRQAQLKLRHEANR